MMTTMYITTRNGGSIQRRRLAIGARLDWDRRRLATGRVSIGIDPPQSSSQIGETGHTGSAQARSARLGRGAPSVQTRQ